MRTVLNSFEQSLPVHCKQSDGVRGAIQASRDGQDRPLLSMLPVQGAGDSGDSSSKCSTVQLAWLDLLQDLTNFFSKELKLLLMMSKSAEMAEFFPSHNKASAWKSGVKNMRNVLTEVLTHIPTSTIHSFYSFIVRRFGTVTLSAVRTAAALLQLVVVRRMT